MIIMVLDHTRDFLSNSTVNISDASLAGSANNLLLFTRLITNLCAPVFIFLVGLSMALAEQNGKSKIEISKFLVTRGLWMIFADFFIISTIWAFSFDLSLRNLQVFSVIGFGMIVLSALIYLPKKIILLLSMIVIFGHNLLDGKEQLLGLFDFIHVSQYKDIQIFDHTFTLRLLYPIIPWIAVPALGYVIGGLYRQDKAARIKQLYMLGASAIVLFVVLRMTNIYGDSLLWTYSSDIGKSLLEFFNCTKYPPSLQYLLYTLGIGLCILAFLEHKLENSYVEKFLLVYGRVPFMFYLMHLVVIHVVAIVLMYINYGRVDLLFSNELIRVRPDYIAPYGYSLLTNYLVWVAIVVFLYPLCKVYGKFKLKYKHIKVLSYL